MDGYRRLQDNMREAMGRSRVAIYQGIVRSVEGVTCTVTFGGMDVSGVRLRASESENASQLLVVPKAGTAVIVGSLGGDFSQLAVLSVDQAESVMVGGGKLGGLVNIRDLTDKLNALVQSFNSHTHTCPSGTTGTPAAQARSFSAGDYEDTTVKH